MNHSESISVYTEIPKRLVTIVPYEAVERTRTLGLPSVFIDMSLATLVFFIVTVAGLAMGAGRTPAMIAAGVLALCGWLALVLWRRRPYPPMPADFTLPDKPDETARVTLVAQTPLAFRVLHDPPLATEVFEPRIFRLMLPLGANAGRAITLYVLLNILLGGGLMLARLVTPLAQTASVVPVGPWDIWIGMSVSLVPFLVLSPTYLRFTPGKLEVLSYGLFSTTPRSVQTFDLWRSRVTAVPDAGYLLIEQPGARLREHREIVSFKVWRATNADVARAAIEAATVQESAPALPTEQLTA